MNERIAGAPGAGWMARTAWAALALAALAALAVFAWVHPLGKAAGAALVLGVLVLMSVRRDAWLVVVPALVPVIDLAAWTGAIHFTESDAVVLGALAVGGLREALRPSASPRHEAWRFGVVQYALLALMVLSYALSTAWQPLLVVATDPALLAGYSTPLNGMRLSKGFVWAVLLLPLVGCALRARPLAAKRALVAGLVLGLVLVSLAVLWERAAFTGLTNFSADYRTTALFWEMNVGGATLDGWLALTLPFVLWLALQARDRVQLLPLLALLALAGYVTFTTFSRGLYLGAALGGAVTVLLMVRQRAGEGRAPVPLGTVLVWGVYVLGLGGVLAEVFQSGGYRGLGAMLGVALAVYALAPVVACLSRRALGLAVMLALVGVVFSVAAMWWVPKGVYLAYALSAACVLGLLLAEPAGRWLALAGGLATAGLLWLAANAALVTMFWSEARVLLPGVLAAVVLLAPLVAVRIRPEACWRPSVQGWVMVALALGALAVVVVSFNTYYASKRMETVSEDLSGRVLHWSLSASLPQSGHERWLGVGVGQFAEHYFWRVPDGMYPGSHHLLQDDVGNRYLRLGGPRHVLGFGELYRVSQRVSPAVQAPVLLALNARVPEGGGRLYVEVCRKHLLYGGQCTSHDLQIPGGADWHRLELALDRQGLGGSGGWLPRLTVFSLANVSRRVVEIDDISLVDGRGQALLDNGNFAAASDFWFFSSDRHHLPWHAKNLWLHYFVEQGWVGAVAFSLLCLAAFFRVTLGRAATHALAPPLAGALTGFFAVGAFDSLVDAPRITLLVMMMMLVALGLRKADQSAHVGTPPLRGNQARTAAE